MPLKHRDIQSALQRKGFEVEERHHRFFVYRFISGSRSVIRTKMSQGAGRQDIGDKLIASMAKQLRLSRKDFFRLVDCSMQQEEYEQKLIAQGHGS